MREMVRIAKALADESRIRMLKLLLDRDICVREMQEIMGISQPQVSRNMKILIDAVKLCEGRIPSPNEKNGSK